MYETERWRLLLREDDQEYIGKSVVDLKRHVTSLALLDAQDWTEFGEIANWFETHVDTVFHPTHYNWQFLMNLGTAAGNAHVHAHATPRYDREVTFQGEVYRDQRWPQSCQSVARRPVNADVTETIATAIRDAI